MRTIWLVVAVLSGLVGFAALCVTGGTDLVIVAAAQLLSLSMLSALAIYADLLWHELRRKK